nr:immunoglobulin light chain junction region [Macaca mulatta]MPN93003.1 immunoglobulin light chain junction region [Macaca mulatta]MPN94275.1 immunoglobulin light chain junction region [Macaca mulatta]MPN96354.1 immunoglobulin light chain junction region [Macaca mulatta]MPN96695.1 immunoglobulin light chain junction region [Macaca mulatta]
CQQHSNWPQLTC